MATMYAADPQKLIREAAKELKKIEELTPPEWAGFVKTGHFKQRPPMEEDWWYMRSAAVLRSVYRLGPIGTNKLRAKYGGKKNRGVEPEIAAKGSGAIIRKVLQQLEKAGLIKKTEKKKGDKGRIITPKGMSFLDKIATRIVAEQKKSKPAPVKEQKEQKQEQAKAQKEERPEKQEKPAAKEQKPAKEERPEKQEKPAANEAKEVIEAQE
jgi:small subunit ribosomal protein S19e